MARKTYTLAAANVAVAGMQLLANGGSIEEKQKLFTIDCQFSNL